MFVNATQKGESTMGKLKQTCCELFSGHSYHTDLERSCPFKCTKCGKWLAEEFQLFVKGEQHE